MAKKKTTESETEPATIRTLADLVPDDRNANKGTERGSGLIESSLRQFGAGRSVLADKHGRLIAGNKTVEGAASAGMARVRVVQTDGHELVVVQRMQSIGNAWGRTSRVRLRHWFGAGASRDNRVTGQR